VRRAWAIAATVAVAVVVAAGPASAHVEVQPAQAAAGQPGRFAFRMPNEESTADTVSLGVRFPADHPVPGVVPSAPDGWTAETTTRTLSSPLTIAGTTVTEVVDTVTWRGSMPPGQAAYFSLTTGPLPTDAGELVFDATQTYDNGDVVHWNEPETPGGPEPAHPAPVLLLTGGVPPPTTVAGAGGTTHGHATTAGPATTDSGGGSSTGVVIGAMAAAVVAIVAVTVLLYRRAGRTPPATGRR
jgi:uncharacterized protein YcnI